MPTAGGSSPAEWMTLTGQPIDSGPVAADLNGFSAVALRCRHETDAAVAVLFVLLPHKCCHPAAGACPAQVKSGDRAAGCRAWRSQPRFHCTYASGCPCWPPLHLPGDRQLCHGPAAPAPRARLARR
jgi:hypothetical protein